MGYQPGSSARKRPVFIANFRSSTRTLSGGDDLGINDADVYDLDARPEDGAPAAGKLRIVRNGLRYNFPPAGPVAEGGTSDGYCYRITFAAGKTEQTYALIVAYLTEQGYGNVPIPVDVTELKQFRLPPKMRHQLSLFGADGYVHNPVKILFPTPASRGALILELYDERAERHLLKFHRR
ncbi:hypothetical protein [Neolewinella antarctica]|uniref:Uncharacterized protein n=1 Tax=Neolewinella antarctica TaxID=442734 RepID=A0ABX0XEK5_9BACT|nr:hypothetical protein [Neolewinella antarctica]NJC27334.1 hypothetical protein [Neolewinella antarctica]